jgi:hypothetical protein
MVLAALKRINKFKTLKPHELAFPRVTFLSGLAGFSALNRPPQVTSRFHPLMRFTSPAKYLAFAKPPSRRTRNHKTEVLHHRALKLRRLP